MWGPVNGEKAALGWPSSHLKRAKKRAVDIKTRPDRLAHASIFRFFVFFPVRISPSPLLHFHTSISSFLLSHFLSPSLPLLSPLSGGVFARVSRRVLLGSIPAKRSVSRDTRLALAHWPGPRCLELVLRSAGRVDES